MRRTASFTAALVACASLLSVEVEAQPAPSSAPAAAGTLPASAAAPASVATPASAASPWDGLVNRLRGDKELPPLVDELPAFSEPAAGPRTATNQFFGVAIGESTLDQVKARMGKAKIECIDRSVRRMVETMREHKRDEVEAARVAGKPDAVTGASILWRRTAYEKSPQVRYACEKLPGSRLKDRKRGDAQGRLLFVFDSEKLPLRHVSYQRTFSETSGEAALEDARTTLAAMTKALGNPTKLELELPPAGGAAALPNLKPFVREWKYADFHARLTLLRLAGQSIVLSEEAEVPLPIRPDAPARRPKR